MRRIFRQFQFRDIAASCRCVFPATDDCVEVDNSMKINDNYVWDRLLFFHRCFIKVFLTNERKIQAGKRGIQNRLFSFRWFYPCWAYDERAMKRKSADNYSFIYSFSNSSNYLIQREKIKGSPASDGWLCRSVRPYGSQRMWVHWEKLLSGMSCKIGS